MGINGNRFKKQDVYKLAKETKKFLELLNGITIQSRYESDIKDIEKQKSKLEEMLLMFEPTILEEYIEQTKIAYREMIRAKKEYERVVKEGCYNETIEKAKNYYKEKALVYEAKKEYRDKLKEVLN
ncbi:hypothetical protein [Clostridium paraputrificum]|uniref:hypothetical protein n=1 Tax=Clostridium paraputrificum TaxID=29363 RepID=UPI00189ACDA4|nr:hypothetical protein [Clostridium paraputrificum]